MKKLIAAIVLCALYAVSLTAISERLLLINGGSVICSEGETEYRGIYALSETFSDVKWTQSFNMEDDSTLWYCRDVSQENVYGFQTDGEVTVYSFDEKGCREEYKVCIGDIGRAIASDIANKGVYYIKSHERDTQSGTYVNDIWYISAASGTEASHLSSYGSEESTYVLNDGSLLYYDDGGGWTCGLFINNGSNTCMLDNLGEYGYMQFPMCVKGNEVYYWKTTDGGMTLYRARSDDDSCEISAVVTDMGNAVALADGIKPCLAMDIDTERSVLYTYVYDNAMFDNGADYSLTVTHQTFFELCRIDLNTGNSELIEWDGYQEGMYRNWSSRNDITGYGYWNISGVKVGAPDYSGYSEYEKPLLIVW